MVYRRVILESLLISVFLGMSLYGGLRLISEDVGAYTYHVGIWIDGNGGFVSDNGVTGGDGTISNPFIIEGWDLSDAYAGITVQNTNAYFVFCNSTTHLNGVGVHLVNVANAVIQNVDIYLNFQGWDYFGIYAVECTNLTVSNCSIQIHERGIYVDSSSNCLFVGNYLESDNYGFYMTNDANISVIDNEVVGSAYGSMFLDSCSNTTIEKNNVTGQWPDDYTPYGVSAQECDNAVICNNTLVGCGKGISIALSEGVRVASNDIGGNNSNDGIVCSSVTNATIADCDIHGFYGDGISISDSSIVSVSGNNITSSNEWGVGILLDSCVNASLSTNKMATLFGVDVRGSVVIHFNSHEISADNLWLGAPVMYFKNTDTPATNGLFLSQLILANCSHVVVEDYSSLRGLELAFVDNSSIRNDTFSGMYYCHVWLWYCADISFSNMEISESRVGLTATNCEDLTFDNNSVNCSWTCFAMNYCRGIVFTANNLSNGTGIRIAYSDNSTVCGNKFSQGDDGIYFSHSSNTTIIGNNISGTGYGINAEYSPDTLVADNDFWACYWLGISLYSSSDWLVYHNNFIDNSVSARDIYGTGNVWDNGYPAGGNYWSDYAENDSKNGPGQNLTGPDAIGDTPFLFDSNMDRYPLMYPFGIDAPPRAWLVVEPSAGDTSTVFSFNASLSFDREDSNPSLEVRWDFDGDGIWDTDWSSDKVIDHTYAAPGIYEVTVEVRDANGTTGTRAVEVEVAEVIAEFDNALALVVAVVGSIGVILAISRRRD